ncbi:MAG: hypothetical protein ACYDAG_01070 [Chloroflexota bacterium]
MAAEQQLPPELIKELAKAAIAKHTRDSKTAESASPRRTKRLPKSTEHALLALTKDLSEFYGFAAVPRSTKEHRLMADIVAESWVPLAEHERQLRLKEEAQERVEELQRENADLRRRIEQRIQDVPRLKAVIRAALTRLSVDTAERHIREDWALLLLKRINAAREILQSEDAPEPPTP